MGYFRQLCPAPERLRSRGTVREGDQRIPPIECPSIRRPKHDDDVFIQAGLPGSGVTNPWRLFRPYRLPNHHELLHPPLGTSREAIEIHATTQAPTVNDGVVRTGGQRLIHYLGHPPPQCVIQGEVYVRRLR